MTLLDCHFNSIRIKKAGEEGWKDDTVVAFRPFLLLFLPSFLPFTRLWCVFFY